MNSNWELFQNAYLTADAEVKQLIDSDKIPRAIDLSVQAGDLPEEQVRAVLLEYPLFVLQVYTKDEIEAKLSSLGITNAAHVVGQLGAVLGIHTTSTPTKQAGLHTMAEDMKAAKNEETTYTSNQAALLRESRTATPNDASTEQSNAHTTAASSRGWGSTQ